MSFVSARVRRVCMFLLFQTHASHHILTCCHYIFSYLPKRRLQLALLKASSDGARQLEQALQSRAIESRLRYSSLQQRERIATLQRRVEQTAGANRSGM